MNLTKIENKFYIMTMIVFILYNSFFSFLKIDCLEKL